jgi:hypothetical protein
MSAADLILKHLQEALASAPIRAIELGSTATSMALGHPPRHFFCFLSPFFFLPLGTTIIFIFSIYINVYMYIFIYKDVGKLVSLHP